MSDTPALWTCHPLEAELGTFAAAWDELNQRLYGNHPLLDSRFIDALLTSFPTPGQLLCKAWVGNDCMAMLMLSKNLVGHWCSFLPSQAPMAPMLVKGQLDLRGLWASLPGSAMQIDLLALDPRFNQADIPFRRSCKSINHALTMAIDLRGSFDAYWQSRSKSLRKNLQRCESRLQAEGVVATLQEHSEPDQVSAAVSRYSELHRLGWKGQPGTAVDGLSGQFSFYTAMMQTFAQKGQARVFELWLDGELAASRLVVLDGHMAVILKTTYNQDMSRFSPGNLLLHKVVQRAFHHPDLRWLEFYTNANIDRLAWATCQRRLVHLSITRNLAADMSIRLHRQWSRLGESRQSSTETVQVHHHPDDMPNDVVKLFALGEGERLSFGADWLRLLTNTVAKGKQKVSIYVLRRAGKPVAALPLMTRLDGEPGLEALSNFYTTLYAPALQPGEGTLALVPLLRAVRRDFAAMPGPTN